MLLHRLGRVALLHSNGPHRPKPASHLLLVRLAALAGSVAARIVSVGEGGGGGEAIGTQLIDSRPDVNHSGFTRAARADDIGEQQCDIGGLIPCVDHCNSVIAILQPPRPDLCTIRLGDNLWR